MTTTSERIRELEIALAEARSQRDQEARDNRQSVVVRLSELRREIDAKIIEAKKLAETADLVFYYSSGYEEFSWVDSQDWTSSTAHC